MIVLPKYQYMVLGQGRPEIYKSMRLAYYEASRRSVAIYVFDPRGDLTCLHGALLVSVGIITDHHMLRNILDREQLYTNDILVESLSKMQGDTAEQVEREVKCKIHNENMVVSKGEGLLGSVCLCVRMRPGSGIRNTISSAIARH